MVKPFSLKVSLFLTVVILEIAVSKVTILEVALLKGSLFRVYVVALKVTVLEVAFFTKQRRLKLMFIFL